MEDQGGGWTLLQRRDDNGNKPGYFMRNWESYKNGFGELSKDFWMGLESIHT